MFCRKNEIMKIEIPKLEMKSKYMKNKDEMMWIKTNYYKVVIYKNELAKEEKAQIYVKTKKLKKVRETTKIKIKIHLQTKMFKPKKIYYLKELWNC